MASVCVSVSQLRKFVAMTLFKCDSDILQLLELIFKVKVKRYYYW